MCRLITSLLLKYFYVMSIFKASRINDTRKRLASSRGLYFTFDSDTFDNDIFFLVIIDTTIYKVRKVSIAEDKQNFM